VYFFSLFFFQGGQLDERVLLLVACHLLNVINVFNVFVANKVLSLYLVPFSSYFTLNNIVSLKSGSEVTQDHSNWYHSKAWVRFPIRLP